MITLGQECVAELANRSKRPMLEKKKHSGVPISSTKQLMVADWNNLGYLIRTEGAIAKELAPSYKARATNFTCYLKELDVNLHAVMLRNQERRKRCRT